LQNPALVGKLLGTYETLAIMGLEGNKPPLEGDKPPTNWGFHKWWIPKIAGL
jgi:hypothetical protein